MAIQWGNNSALAGFQNALALGADIGGAIRQNRERSALADYLGASQQTTMGGSGIVATPQQQTSPQMTDDPREGAFNKLLKVNPELAMQAQGMVQSREAAARKVAQEQQAIALRQKAAQGDPAALQQLVGIDFEAWKSLDAAKRQQVKAQNDYIGQAALRISQLPPAQQAAAWDDAVTQGAQAGYSGLAEYRGKFSPQALQGAIDNAGLVSQFIALAEPKYIVKPTDSDLINVRDPQAVAAAAGGQPKQVGSKAEYDALPAGAEYVAPDGSIKRKGGASSNASGGFPATRPIG